MAIVFLSVSMLNQLSAGEKAPDFKLPDVKGKMVSLSDYRSKVVLIDFWATWCPPCRKEIPHFNELYQQYKAQGLEILGISVDQEGKSAIDKFLKNNRVAYPILFDDKSASLAYQKLLKPEERGGIPFTFIVDKQGKVVQYYVGYRDKAVFEKVIVDLLKN
jgi:peroxiredoxin